MPGKCCSTHLSIFSGFPHRWSLIHSLQWDFISDRADMTTQQLRGVLHIVWTTRAAISLCIQLSLTVYYGDWGGGAAPIPQPAHRSCLWHWSYLFCSDILSLLYSAPCLQPVSWLSQASKWDSSMEKKIVFGGVWGSNWDHWRLRQDVSKTHQT